MYQIYEGIILTGEYEAVRSQIGLELPGKLKVIIFNCPDAVMKIGNSSAKRPTVSFNPVDIVRRTIILKTLCQISLVQ